MNAELLLDAAAAYRVTRLIVADTITEPPRAAVIRWAYEARDGRDVTYDLEATSPSDTWTERVHDDPDPPKLATLVTCPWCMGVWVAAAVTVARRVAPRWWQPAAETAAIAAAVGLLASWER